MERMIDETNRRRAKQLEYNKQNNITPTTVIKSMGSGFDGLKRHGNRFYSGPEEVSIAADPLVPYMSKDALRKRIEAVKKEMSKAAKELDFISAAHFRDEMLHLQKLLNENA